jgi:hypothetical protein
MTVSGRPQVLVGSCGELPSSQPRSLHRLLAWLANDPRENKKETAVPFMTYLRSHNPAFLPHSVHQKQAQLMLRGGESSYFMKRGLSRNVGHIL